MEYTVKLSQKMISILNDESDDIKDQVFNIIQDIKNNSIKSLGAKAQLIKDGNNMFYVRLFGDYRLVLIVENEEVIIFDID